MRSMYLNADGVPVAAVLHPARAASSGVGVLLVPPFGWDDQTSYRPRRAWAEELAGAGHTALRISLPGSGDSGGTPRDPDLVAAWTAAVRAGTDWLCKAGATRVAVVAMGLGGLITLKALAGGARADDLVLWGVPVKGRSYIREVKAFGRLEASQTGEDPSDTPEGELRAGGHVMTAETAAAVGALNVTDLVAAAPARALVLGRDGNGPEDALLDALRVAGTDVRTDRGKGWGGALAGPPSTYPTEIFTLVNDWLGQPAPGDTLTPPPLTDTAEFGAPGARVRETPVAFTTTAGVELVATIAEPVDAPRAGGTIVLYNAGSIRRIGPNRMWVEAARRWAAFGVPVVRVDLESIGDAGGGDGVHYLDSEHYHTQRLVDQALAAVDMAVARGLPDRFLLGGMCSGAYWAFQAALADPRAIGIMTLNQRVMFWDPLAEPSRELKRFLRIATPQGFRNMLIGERKLLRLWRLIVHLAKSPTRMITNRRAPAEPVDLISEALLRMHERGQTLDLAFSLEEELHDALREPARAAEIEEMSVELYDLPYVSHTLKPIGAQHAANAFLDAVVERTFPRSE